MNVKITSKPIRGKVRAVTSKSDAHRALIAAALSSEQTRVEVVDLSADISATVDCLRALGAEISRDGYIYTVNPVTDITCFSTLDCGESGSTLRFLLPVAAALGGSYEFTGGGRLPQRPISELVHTLEDNGAEFSSDTLPFTVSGGLRAGTYSIPGSISSQFITGLLMALPLVGGDSAIVLTSLLKSSAYVDMTLSVLEAFGIHWQRTDNKFILEGEHRYVTPGSYKTEGDWSSAAFMLASGVLGGEVTVDGLNFNSLQADKVIFDILASSGAHLSVLGDNVTASRSRLRPMSVDVSECPDLFPILAVLAASTDGKCALTGAGRLRFKECDRLAATADMIRRLGGDCAESAEGLIINGHSTLAGGECDSYGDHRMAMAASVAALICEGPVTVTGAECVSKSYPAFYDDLVSLGGSVHVI